MADIASSALGSFGYMDLSTSDHHAAAEFYCGLFGLTPFPMGPTYTVLRRNGRDVAGAFTTAPSERNPNPVPHWTLYVAVEDADATARRTEELGGKVTMPPMDIMTLGRTAVIQDPTGAVFQLWQAKDYAGFTVKNEPGAFCWADLSTPDQQSAAKFYAELFNWKLPPGEGGYLHIVNGEEFMGGIPPSHSGKDAGEPQPAPHWLIYWQVADCDSSVAKLKEMGGTVKMPPMSVGDVGRMAIVADPQGAAFALFQMEHRQA